MKEDERILGNDDAPIVIGDTSIPIKFMALKDKKETTIRHTAGKGNKDHYHNNAKGHFFVHDKDGGKGKDYRAVCFDFASLPKSTPIPADATSWEISFEDGDGNLVLSLNWVAELTNEKDAGDITLDADVVAQDPKDKTTLTLEAQVATMRRSEEHTSELQSLRH